MSAEFAALVRYFQQHGFDAVRRGPKANAHAEDDGLDLVVVEANGALDEALRVCRRSVAEGGAPVVVVAPRVDEDAVAALEAGAADVLARPFHPREALARVRAVLRRRRAGPSSTAAGWAFGDWILEAERHVLRTPEGQDVVLPLGEFALLRGFVDQPLSILSRDDLKNLASAAEAVLDARVMDVRISRLRARFGRGSGHKVIETVRGEGYRFALPVRALNPGAD
jgi:two-component system OmpR family response regulator